MTGNIAPKPVQMTASATRSGSTGPHWTSHDCRRVGTRRFLDTARHRTGGGSHVPGRGAPRAYDPGMPPLLLLSILIACLLALLPVWRLKVAGWPTGWLVGAWLTYTVM